eukprot:GHVP01041498.1.p2 GENE.GHVP01041498.1~~GHVP01041498.1.p2  ORF type:complete len:549 (+),score=116.18 GHVP01041498.1:1180-2826(+)
MKSFAAQAVPNIFGKKLPCDKIGPNEKSESQSNFSYKAFFNQTQFNDRFNGPVETKSSVDQPALYSKTENSKKDVKNESRYKNFFRPSQIQHSREVEIQNFASQPVLNQPNIAWNNGKQEIKISVENGSRNSKTDIPEIPNHSIPRKTLREPQPLEPLDDLPTLCFSRNSVKDKQPFELPAFPIEVDPSPFSSTKETPVLSAALCRPINVVKKNPFATLLQNVPLSSERHTRREPFPASPETVTLCPTAEAAKPHYLGAPSEDSQVRKPWKALVEGASQFTYKRPNLVSSPHEGVPAEGRKSLDRTVGPTPNVSLPVLNRMDIGGGRRANILESDSTCYAESDFGDFGRRNIMLPNSPFEFVTTSESPHSRISTLSVNNFAGQKKPESDRAAPANLVKIKEPSKEEIVAPDPVTEKLFEPPLIPKLPAPRNREVEAYSPEPTVVLKKRWGSELIIKEDTEGLKKEKKSPVLLQNRQPTLSTDPTMFEKIQGYFPFKKPVDASHSVNSTNQRPVGKLHVGSPEEMMASRRKKTEPTYEDIGKKNPYSPY